MAAPVWKPLPKWGKKIRLQGTKTAPGGAKRFAIRKSLNYTRIKKEVMAAIANLPADQRNSIPAAATLPEIITGYALAKLGYLPGMAQAQISEGGGRLRVGGSVVDWLLHLGSRIIVLRCQGDYFHAMPERKQKDIVQYDRLHQLKYLVSDLWEKDLYLAWIEGRIVQFVAQKILEAS